MVSQSEKLTPRSESDGSENRLVDLIEKPAWKVLLYELVEKEKLDPWNIDIVVLANSYLKKIQELKEFNFSIPANAILAASIFLAFKSKKIDFSATLPRNDVEEVLDFYDDWDDLSESFDPSTGERFMLEPEITAVPQRVPQRRVSLDELINAVQEVMDKKGQKESAKTREDYEDTILEDAFENFRVDAKDIESQISTTFSAIDELKDSQSLVRFSEVVEKFKDGRKDDESVLNVRVITESLVPVLYLSNERRVNVWQDEFFGEIFIKVLSEEERLNSLKETGPGDVEDERESTA